MLAKLQTKSSAIICLRAHEYISHPLYTTNTHSYHCSAVSLLMLNFNIFIFSNNIHLTITLSSLLYISKITQYLKLSLHSNVLNSFPFTISFFRSKLSPFHSFLFSIAVVNIKARAIGMSKARGSQE